MDGDPAVKPELDTFSLSFPLPYRIAFVLVLGTVNDLAICHHANLMDRRLGVGPQPTLPFNTQDRTLEPESVPLDFLAE